MARFFMDLAGKILVPFIEGIHGILPLGIIVFFLLAGLALMVQQKKAAAGFATSAVVAVVLWVGLPILVDALWP